MNFLNNLNADNFQMEKEVFERKIENLKKSFQEIFKEHFEKDYNVLVNVPVGLRDQPNAISLQIYGDGEVSPKNYVVDLSESKNSIKEQLRVYEDEINNFFIIFVVLYLLLSIILLFAKKFLKSIKLSNYNEFLGGVLGVLKTTFIIFIIYIVVLVGSSYSKRLKEIRDKSILVSKITEYIYGYSQGFPEFIQKDVNSYRRKIKEKEIENNVLRALKEEKKTNNIK